VGQNEYEFVFDFSQFHAPERAELAPGAAQVRIVRMVMPPPFAKALLHTLGRAIAEHERFVEFVKRTVTEPFSKHVYANLYQKPADRRRSIAAA
jgi:hypothetical protein